MKLRREKHLGAISELRACSYLLEQGYEVFRNVSMHGPVDLIGIKDGQCHYFDIKTRRPNPNGELPVCRLTPEQEKLGVKLLVLLPDGTIKPDAEALGSTERTRACGTCGKVFSYSKSDRRYCSKSCRPSMIAWIGRGRRPAGAQD